MSLPCPRTLRCVRCRPELQSRVCCRVSLMLLWLSLMLLRAPVPASLLHSLPAKSCVPYPPVAKFPLQEYTDIATSAENKCYAGCRTGRFHWYMSICLELWEAKKGGGGGGVQQPGLLLIT